MSYNIKTDFFEPIDKLIDNFKKSILFDTYNIDTKQLSIRNIKSYIENDNMWNILTNEHKKQCVIYLLKEIESIKNQTNIKENNVIDCKGIPLDAKQGKISK